MRKAKLVQVVIVALLSVGIAWTQVTTGAISGSVKDSSGAVLPGVGIVILNEDTGMSRTVQTNEAGHYSALALSLGNYRVTATLGGFQTGVRRGIVLTVGREAVVDLEMSVGAVTQTVEVTGEAPLVESTTSSVGSLVDAQTIRELPLNGRSYDQLALLQPGVIQANSQLSGTNVGNFTYGSGARFSVGGGRGNTNSFLLDGTDINDQANNTPGGAAGTNLGVDTIREFKIFTSSYPAEFGRSSGAVMTAITRSGTNELRGSLFEYFRNSALDARNFFDVANAPNPTPPPPFRRNQFGGTLGGPIQKDKTFFFGGYEGLRQGLGTTQNATVPTEAAKQGNLPTGRVQVSPVAAPFLKLWPTPNGRDFLDGRAEYISSPTTVTNEDYFIGRVDHQLNDKVSLFGRYTFDDDSVDIPGSNPNFANFNSSRRQYSTLQVNTVLSPKAVNHSHIAYNRTFQRNDNQVTVSLGPEFSFVPGKPMGSISIGTLGGSFGAISGIGTGATRLFGYNLIEGSDDFSYVAGNHSVKTGVNIRRIRDNTEITSGAKGSYTFDSFADFLAARAATMSVSPPGLDSYRGFRQTMIAMYVQDDVNVNSRLTLNLGLRWETVTDPTEAHGKISTFPDPWQTATVNIPPSKQLFKIGKKNFQPRVGLAWRLNDGGKTVVRAGGGIFHNQILPAYYASPLQEIPPFYALVIVARPNFPNTGYLQAQQLGQAGAAATPRVRVFAPFLKTPVTYQYNLTIEQQLSKSTVVQIAYAGTHATNLLTNRPVNHPAYALLQDGRKFFPVGAPRINPNYESINRYQTDTNSLYNGVTISMRQRSSSGFQYQAFYTFSKGMDVISGTAFAESSRSAQDLMDPEDPGREWALSDFDVRHNFVFNVMYPLPFRSRSKVVEAILGGWSIGSIGTFHSGQPFTALMVNNSNSRSGASNQNDRPDLKPGASNNPILGGPDRYFDPTAFSRPTPGTLGNLGRNTLIGPGHANWDVSLEKTFPLREGASALFRTEVFNVLNHANFALPNPSALTAAGAVNANAGRITATTTSSRQIQFALRINF